VKKQVCRSKTAVFLLAAILATLCAVSKPASAGTVSTAVLGMFPANVGEIAYADLKTARKFTWFPQLREQLLPKHFREFEKFLANAGVDPNTQVEELAWGTIQINGGDAILGVALGGFNPSSTEAQFKQQKLPTFDVHGYHLYAFGSGTDAGDILFTFIDANTAAFGNRPALEKLIDVRTGAAESILTNNKLAPLITEANGTGLIWAVLDQNYTHLAMQQLVPQASQFPQAATIIDRLHAMTINVAADSGIDAHFQAVCSSPDDANLLAAALQAGLMYRRYQEASTDPALAGALDQVRVSPAGDRLKIEAPVSQDQLLTLIRSGALTTSM
jgi:hypothetical protein